MTIANVVVGTDGSPTAEAAVQQAATLAVAFEARLVIVTAYMGHHRVDDAPEEVQWSLSDANVAEGAARKGRELASAAGATRVTVQSIEGHPAEVLLQVAQDFNADLIVVGSRGLGSLRSKYLGAGSVASAVSHHAPCDVLIAQTV